MSYPFPGMNPWLEDARIWRNVHQSVVTALRDVLAPQLEPRYFVDVETHTYISTSPSLPIQSRYPDVSVLKLSDTAQPYTAEGAPGLPVVVEIPLPEPFEEPYLKVRLVPDGEVVTVIELLSHTNKRAGDERRSYLQKCETLIDSDVHFVEIDLLRAHQPMTYTEHRLADYRIFIHRREMSRKAHLYPFTVQQAIPIFPLPLLPGDQEPLVDLGDLLHELYDRARYRLVIDYSKPPSPALGDQDAAWAAACLPPA